MTNRLLSLEDNYKSFTIAQEKWPAPLSDPKQLYRNFYDMMQKVSYNIVCACCGIIGHNNIDEFITISACDEIFMLLTVNSEDVLFSFECGIVELDQQHVMIDPLAITDQSTISVCQKCYSSLSNNVLPLEALANFRWIGPVPEELQDLTWPEEALIARSHLFGRVFRMEERNRESAYSSLKGHVVLVPQNTMRLLDILPLSPDSLADIAHVVWVGKSEPDITKLAPQFTVRKTKVIDALQWLQIHHEDYRNVTIDTVELDKWPSVFITEALLSSIGRVQNSAAEDAMQNGFATEDIDVEECDGTIPNTVSGMIDVNNISQPRHLKILQELQSLQDLQNDLTINVVPGSKVLEYYQESTYFTSAFPTLFPWGTGKHIDPKRGKSELKLQAWIQLLLKNSSRYYLCWVMFC